MKQSLTSQITAGIGMALALLILNAATSYRNTLKLLENERWVSHTHQVLTELEATLSTLKDAETGQRGYLLTGEERYLEPYHSAIARINQQVVELQQLTADNNRQQQQPNMVWGAGIDPEQFTLAQIDPNRLTFWELRDTIAEVASANHSTATLESNLWHKFASPLSTLLMPLLAAIAAFGLAPASPGPRRCCCCAAALATRARTST